jgi:tRNA A-37 threonylcarbamoyl transferase component Bud32
MVALVSSRRLRFVPLFVLAALVATVSNISWLLPYLGAPEDSALLQALTQPSLSVIGNGLAGALAIWGLIRLARSGSSREKMARSLIRRRDYYGAAEIYLQMGSLRRALELFRRGRAWSRAAAVALDLGLEEEGATLLRRAGGRHLAEAARLYRRLGDRRSAVRCDHDLAEWLTNDGHFDEAIEAWLRAGEPERALRATSVALSENRLQPSSPAFPAAVRAAEETSDHRTLAQLHEAKGNWRSAAYSWREAGEQGRAAENFRKIGLLDEAARCEAAAGRPREAAQLRLRQLRQLQERLRATEVRGLDKTPETDRLRVLLQEETERLIPDLSDLGMQNEMIEVLSSSGRTQEAVARLVAENQDAAAAELARDAQRWDLAAPILERLNRWGEASDVHELAGNLTAAARCAERAGEDERALQIYRSLNHTEKAAHCLARLGSLQDALIELHRAGQLREACEILRSYPGPVPDIPDVILDMAEWAYDHGDRERAIACLQRAVVGVALQPGRLDPAVALARLLDEAGEADSAMAQLDRVLAFDYSFEPAQTLRAQVVARQARAAPADTRPPTAPAPSEPSPAERQRYEILTELGRGGMGVVYKARDTRLERDVAIKVLRTTSPEEAARLEQEAKAAATLNHSGIVTIFDFEAGFDGYFITMEYVPGDALDHLMRSHPERIRDNLLGILVRLADAIAYAHSHHVIHRDLKPGNILLTPLHEVKILDFGIAARLDTGAGAAPSVCGTPYYMAPEQIRGEAPTPATDIYAFGATSFHLATGQPPFKKGNVIDAHLNTPPPNPADLAHDLPPGLDQIILRCLEKQSDQRFQSADALREALLELGTTAAKAIR